MRYVYDRLIQENIAPKGATRIVVKNGDEEVCSIPATRFGGLTPPNGEPLYSIGLVSDCHTFKTATINDMNYQSNVKLRNALSYFSEKVSESRRRCVAVVGCGDFCQTGFYLDNKDDYDESQMLNYQEIISECPIPVFELYGNHENFHGRNITDNLARAKELIGIPHTAYTVSSEPDSDEVVGTTARPNRYAPVGEDLYILCGQPAYNQVMSENDFAWLKKILADNTHRRCFIAVHSYMEGDCGDPLDVRNNSIFAYSSDFTTRFVEELSKYPNALLMHGHSHTTLECQTVDINANYSTRKGFKSIHVPSCGNPLTVTGSNPDGTPYSQCYIMDVYTDCVVLNGLSYVDGEWVSVAVGTYKIEV